MSHWIILPVALPATMAALMLLGLARDTVLARSFSFLSTGSLLAIAIALLIAASNGPPEAYLVGNWRAPFGIVLVLDRLSAMMLVLTAVLALVALIYAVNGTDQAGRHFHALFQFQLMGVNGAFLTGDVFNLFVFFEVLLIASYGLMLHGAGRERLQAGVHYVVINLTGSALFLFAVAMIYAVTGTLNIADLAVKVPQVTADDQAILQAGGLLLLVVFCIKAAMVPLHFWLPGTYANTSAPVAALFAIMTKVGAYSVLRVHGTIFGANAGDAALLAWPYLLPAALITLSVGIIGALAAANLRRLVAFSVIGSMGTLMTAFALFTEASIVGGLYYLVHSTLVAGALFLIVDQIRLRRGSAADGLIAATGLRDAQVLGGLFMAAGIAMAGMPPLSGFIGKLLILDSALDLPGATWVFAIILTTSLLSVFAFARAGSLVFWKVGAPAQAAGGQNGELHALPALPWAAAAALLAGTAVLAAFAGPVTDYLQAAATQLLDPSAYIAAVLERMPEGR